MLSALFASAGCELLPAPEALPSDASISVHPDAGDASKDRQPIVDGPWQGDEPEATDALGQETGARDDLELTTFLLKDGTNQTGQWVATYNHNYWWHDAGAELTFGVFDINRSAAYPGDESFRFLSSLDVTSIVSEPCPDDRRSYRDALRDWNATIDQVPLAGAVHVITANDSYHLEEDGFGNFGYDLVITDDQGQRFLKDGKSNEDYLAWGAQVVLPTTGYVVEVVRDQQDNTPGSYQDNATANLVGVHLGGSYYLYVLHLQKDSIPSNVTTGKNLLRGSPIGKVGNSGVTLEPHLHLVLLWFDESEDPPRSWSVPVEFRDVDSSETPTGPFSKHPFLTPKGRSWIRSSEP
jgi:hypothetical protein